MRLIFAQSGLSAAGLLLVVWFHPHYAAPVLTCVILLVIQGLRYLRTWKIRGRPVGVSLVRWIVLLTAFTLPVNLLAYKFPALANYWAVPELGMPPRYILLLLVVILLLILLRAAKRSVATAQVGTAIPLVEFGLLLVAMWQACSGTRSYKPDEVASPAFARSSIEQRFFKLPGEHLVIVRYFSKHNVHDEYVYNEGDIDHAKTVWAREIPGMDTNSLLNYFSNRDVWILEPDEVPQRLYPYSSQKPGTYASNNSSAE